MKLPQARTSASPVALRTKTDVVGAKACQRARHIRSYRTALRLGDRGRNDVQRVPDFPLAFDPSGRGLRCPTLNSLSPALQSGLDVALAVADPAFGAKAREPGFAVALQNRA